NTFSKIVPREGHEVEVVCWDSVGMDYYGLYGQQFQRGAHKGVHMVLMCFDISEPDSLENVEDVWNPEANNHLWRIPKILVGCKKDLRNDVRRTMSVSPYKADKLAMRIGAIAYFETTAVGMTGLQELFNYIAEALVKRKSKKAGVFRRLISRGERRSSGVSDSGAEG
ncbi:P-loop containing nucleoside triphosphate hydrolase protein, partial [Ophiobolus disseminans]